MAILLAVGLGLLLSGGSLLISENENIGHPGFNDQRATMTMAISNCLIITSGILLSVSIVTQMNYALETLFYGLPAVWILILYSEVIQFLLRLIAVSVILLPLFVFVVPASKLIYSTRRKQISPI